MENLDYNEYMGYRPRKSRVNRSVVRMEVKPRYYVYGKGYNTELEAYIQVAKREISRQCDRELFAALAKFGAFSTLSQREILLRSDMIHGWDDRWYAKRYPVRDKCQCHFCWSNGKPSTVAGIPSGRGCWIAKMADYRRLARQIISDIRHGFRDLEGNKVLALEARNK